MLNVKEARLPEFKPFSGVVRIQEVKKGTEIVVFEKKKPPFLARVLKIKKTPQSNNSRVLIESADGSLIHLGGGTSVLG